MLAVDTNVLVRLLTRDDRQQAERATALLESNVVWIAKTVLLETEWVLRSLYGFPPHQIAAALSALAGLQQVRLESPLEVAKALDWFAVGLDFADALHITGSLEAGQFATFDEKLAKRAKRLAGLDLLSV